MKGLTPSEPVIRITIISVGFAGEPYEFSKDHRYHDSDHPQHPAFRAVSVLVARAAYFASRAQHKGSAAPSLSNNCRQFRVPMVRARAGSGRRGAPRPH